MHVGVIPDGNRRWANRRLASLVQAYTIGFCNVIDTTVFLSEQQCEHITFFGLSNDNNCKRPRDEVDLIFSHIIDSMTTAAPFLRDRGIQITFYGQLDELEQEYRAGLSTIEQTTRQPAARTNLNILVNYRAEWDIAKRAGFVDTSTIPACELVFRSGRVPRLSGFLPLQSANAMLHFSATLWPDVQRIDFAQAMRRWGAVRRTFGA